MAKKSEKQIGDHFELQQALSAKWELLTWDMLDRWAGRRSVARGKAYHRQGRVSRWGLLADGSILATVAGGTDYNVKVQYTTDGREEIPLDSSCTCPVGHQCKHAVAAVLELLECLEADEQVPMVDPDDPRLRTLGPSLMNYEDDWDIEESEQSESHINEAVRRHIRAKSHDELVAWVVSLLETHPELFGELRERIRLKTSDFDSLMASTRKMIADVTDEPGWVNHWDWDGDSSLPDYAPLQARFEHFLTIGRFDELVELGQELFEAGVRQIELSHDEGETAMALRNCMAVVFEALARSSRSGAEKLLYASEAGLKDDYGILDDATEVVFDRDYTAEDWSGLADALTQTLDDMPREESDGCSIHYKRRRRSDVLLGALELAGRTDELVGVHEREARATNSYPRYVRYLMGHRHNEQARKWAEEGIRKTSEKLPGIASELLGLLREIAHQEKEHKFVAAYDAYAFFSRPSSETFHDLLKSAGKARCKTAVAEGAQAFLQTGAFPWTTGGKSTKPHSDWPLPKPEALAPMLATDKGARQPHYTVLLDIALAAKDSDAVLRWYEALGSPSPRRTYKAMSGRHYADRVAAAVSQTHPKRALKIHRQTIDALLPHANQNNYAQIGNCLRKMRPIHKALGQDDKWQNLVDSLRAEYRRRPRFIEVLDGLDDGPIVRSRKKR